MTLSNDERDALVSYRIKKAFDTLGEAEGKTYRQLLQSLQTAGFSFITFSKYIESEKLKTKSEKLERPDNPKTNKEQVTRNK